MLNTSELDFANTIINQRNLLQKKTFKGLDENYTQMKHWKMLMKTI
jgi:hypothetical protein